MTDPEVKTAVGQSARYFGLRWPHIHEAPALVVVCARKSTPFARDDCIFAGANIMLAAADRGLGTCWIGGFKEAVVAELLGVPSGYILPGFCTIGYPSAETATPEKKPLEAMLHQDTFTGGKGGMGALRGPLEVLGRLVRLQFKRRRRSED